MTQDSDGVKLSGHRLVNKYIVMNKYNIISTVARGAGDLALAIRVMRDAVKVRRGQITTTAPVGYAGALAANDNSGICIIEPSWTPPSRISLVHVARFRRGLQAFLSARF